eukprot:207144-Chlamydomonas_euryale.AAC.15
MTRDRQRGEKGWGWSWGWERSASHRPPTVRRAPIGFAVLTIPIDFVVLTTPLQCGLCLFIDIAVLTSLSTSDHA